MPSGEPSFEALRRLVLRMAPVLMKAMEDDPDLRAEVRQCLLDFLQHPLFASPTAEAGKEPAVAEPPAPEPTTAPSIPVQVDAVELQSRFHEGQVPVSPEAVGNPPARRSYNGPPPKELGRRFGFKARACREIARILELPRSREGPIEIRSLYAEARGVRLWMHGTSVHAATPLGWLATGEAYDLASRAVVQAAEAGNPGEGSQGEDWLQLLASVQCRLRTVLLEVHPGVEDPDQIHLHSFLRAAGATHQVMLRHLKLTDAVPKAAEQQLEKQLAELTPDASRRVAKRSDPINSQLKRLHYHLKHLRGPGAVARASAPAHDVEVVVSSLRELLALGIQLQDVRLAGLEAMDPEAFQLQPQGAEVRDWLDRHKAAVAAQAAAEASADSAQDSDELEDASGWDTPEIRRVRRRLEGRVVVLVGGDPQSRRVKAYEEAFGLERLEWPDTRHHHSNERLKALIERPEVAVVAVAIRWASHSRSELRELVRAAGKSWVVLERGINPSQFAAAYLEQCSGSEGGEI